MAVGKEQTTSRLKMNIKSSPYLVHYRPYQVLNKGKQVASSTKLGLGDNVVLAADGMVDSNSCQPNRNLFGVGTKFKEVIFNSNSQINSIVTTRT